MYRLEKTNHMSSEIPVIKQTAWISIFPHLLVMGLIIFIWYQFTKSHFVIYGSITYLALSQLLRRIIAKEHKKGIAKVKREHFEEAISDFKNSYEFFNTYEWIDKYRYFILLSSTKMSYKEMALNNIAFCYGQIGNGELAKEYYEKTLDEFPESGIAKAALKLINSVSKK